MFLCFTPLNVSRFGVRIFVSVHGYYTDVLCGIPVYFTVCYENASIPSHRFYLETLGILSYEFEATNQRSRQSLQITSTCSILLLAHAL